MIQDLFMQMWEGNFVAWLAFALIIAVAVLCGVLFVIFWKMPQPARKLLANNLFGNKPVVANAYDNQVLIFQTPRIFHTGLFYDKDSGFHFPPRLRKDANLDKVNQDIVTKTFHIQGAPGQFYLAYSGKGEIVNSELQALMEYDELYGDLAKKGNPTAEVQVPKKALINALEKMKDETVNIKPVWITTFLDPRKIKQYLSKAYEKSQIGALENEIRDDLRKQYETFMNSKGMMILLILNLVGIIVVALHEFGFIH